jgi:ABC-2 type transport system ATP-binding protein
MLSIKDLTVAYDKHVVIESLNLEFESGQIHGLVGLNGSGKTTFLNTIYGLIKPEQGSITWNEHSLKPLNIGYLETSNFFYPKITGLEYLQIFKARNRDFDIENWNKIFELPLKELIENYSTGMKKKLALLGILSLNRPLIILDEPYNGLDLESGHHLKNIILTLKNSGKTIIVTSHILESLTVICDYIHYLCDKKIQKSYSKNNFNVLEHEIFSNHNQDKNQLINTLLK